jgi:hypothetical protein
MTELRSLIIESAAFSAGTWSHPSIEVDVGHSFALRFEFLDGLPADAAFSAVKTQQQPGMRTKQQAKFGMVGKELHDHVDRVEKTGKDRRGVRPNAYSTT